MTSVLNIQDLGVKPKVLCPKSQEFILTMVCGDCNHNFRIYDTMVLCDFPDNSYL